MRFAACADQVISAVTGEPQDKGPRKLLFSYLVQPNQCSSSATAIAAPNTKDAVVVSQTKDIQRLSFVSFACSVISFEVVARISSRSASDLTRSICSSAVLAPDGCSTSARQASWYTRGDRRSGPRHGQVVVMMSFSRATVIFTRCPGSNPASSIHSPASLIHG